jgi:phosphoserine phosphatase
MLEMVENPIAFNPDESLLKIAEKAGWLIIIERKNIAYKLEKGQHGYTLAETTIL